MFPVCKHCRHDEGEGQNLLIKSRRRRKKKARGGKTHSLTSNYLSAARAAGGNGVMYESE